MFLKSVLPSFGLLCLGSLVLALPKIRHVRVDDAQLVSTGLGVFGVSEARLLERNWKTVTVNGDDVLAIAENCSPTKMSLSSLPKEDSELIKQAKIFVFEAQKETGPKANKMIRSTVLFEDDGKPSAPSKTKMELVNVRGSTIVKLADDYVSVALPDKPQKVVRVFLTGSVTTFVYEDGQVQMKPSECLDADEKKVVQQVRTTLQLGEYSLKKKSAESVKSLDEQMKERVEREKARQEYLRTTPIPIVRKRLID